MILADRRTESRRDVKLPAFLYDSNGAQLLACTLRNISAAGAGLELATAGALPSMFLLSLTRGGAVRRRCQTVWQDQERVGLRFIAA
jgi:hypothetical protein